MNQDGLEEELTSIIIMRIMLPIKRSLQSSKFRILLLNLLWSFAIRSKGSMPAMFCHVCERQSRGYARWHSGSVLSKPHGRHWHVWGQHWQCHKRCCIDWHKMYTHNHTHTHICIRIYKHTVHVVYINIWYYKFMHLVTSWLQNIPQPRKS